LVVTVIDIMRTHPVIGGIVQQNPFFMPPEQIPARTAFPTAIE